MRSLSMLLAASLLVAFAATGSTHARPAYATVFKKDYIDKVEDKKFAEELNKGTNKCLACHQGTKGKKVRNDFGKEFGKLLTKKEEKDPVKIADALKKALQAHVDPKDDKSPTYGENWKENKWPNGKSLDDLKKEPEAEKK